MRKRNDARELSSRQDLLLAPANCLQGSLISRKGKKMCEIRAQQNQDVIYENFVQCYRRKQVKDRQFIFNSLRNHFIFLEQDAQVLQALIEKFKFCSVEANQYLIKQGQNASSFFVLYSGNLSVQIDGTSFRKLSPGQGFGQLALLYDAPRSASIMSLQTSYLWYINRFTFMHAVRSLISSRYDDSHALISSNQFFEQFTVKQRHSITEIALSQKYLKGEFICKQGELASSLFILATGCIVRSLNNVELGTIEARGSLLEEQAAFTKDAMRRQTLMVAEDTQLVALGIKDIERVLGKSLPLAIARNKVKQLLKDTGLYQQLSKEDMEILLDSFEIIDIQAASTVSTAKFIFSILQRHIQNGEPNKLYGLGNLISLPSQQQPQIVFTSNGKIVKTTRQRIELALGCSIEKAISRKLQQRCLRMQRASILSNLKTQSQNFSLADFAVRRVLGEGNFGKVLLVTHAQSGQHYALKCISKTETTAKHLQPYLKNEKQALESIVSPFIVYYVRSFRDECFIYFLMEFVRGKELFDVIRQLGIIEHHLAQFYIASLLLVLEYLHNNCIVYRDLKPENVVVGSDGYLKLVDMGTCKHLPKHFSKTFTIIGTPIYMAPEIIVGKGYSYSADLWSLGVMLYEFIFGDVPYGRNCDDIYSIYSEIVTSNIQLPSVDPTTRILLQLLDKNPNNRLGGSYCILKQHAFFGSIPWVDLSSKVVMPPYCMKREEVLDDQSIDKMPRSGVSEYLQEGAIIGIGLGDIWDEQFTR